MMKSNYDVVIIGAGVTGCAIAREVSKYNLSCCVLEKEEDVCSGTSKANSAIVHAGYDATPGSLKAKFNVEGNALIASLAQTLDFPFQKIGSLVLCFSEDDLPKLNQLLEKGITNGVPDLKLLTREEVLVMEPHITEEVVAALYAPTGGIVCPFHMTIAFAENAYENGVEFFFHTKVHSVKKDEDRFTIQTSQGDIKSTYVVNAAGIYGDQISNGINSTQYEIIPRRGEYCLLDKEAGN